MSAHQFCGPDIRWTVWKTHRSEIMARVILKSVALAFTWSMRAVPGQATSLVKNATTHHKTDLVRLPKFKPHLWEEQPREKEHEILAIIHCVGSPKRPARHLPAILGHHLSSWTQNAHLRAAPNTHTHTHARARSLIELLLWKPCHRISESVL